MKLLLCRLLSLRDSFTTILSKIIVLNILSFFEEAAKLTFSLLWVCFSIWTIGLNVHFKNSLMTNTRSCFYPFLSILLGMSPSSGNDSDKPHMFYSQLIAEGLVNAPDGMLTLFEIYNAISTRHPYYKMEARNWKNSVRHNLTLNKSFNKVVYFR